MMRRYKDEELVRIARRDNNLKRPYLLVNPLQGKHIPVDPRHSMELFENLAEVLRAACGGERLLLIGFAETATAIGAAVAAHCPEAVWYIHTTRECVEGTGEYLYFSEVHSHATEQKLIAGRLDQVIGEADRIVFVEDEVTTGNTILNLIGCLRERYQGMERLSFGILSILNSMTDSAMEHFQKLKIPCLYLNRIESRDYGEGLERYGYEPERIHGWSGKGKGQISIISKEFPGKQDPRAGVSPKEYRRACEELAGACAGELKALLAGRRILVLGTEEFMYPALVAARLLEDGGAGLVRFHATTRSPILPSGEPDYPLFSRYELRSVYDGERTAYLYNLESYDVVLWLHDAPEADPEGIASLSAALESAGCGTLLMGKWVIG